MMTANDEQSVVAVSVPGPYAGMDVILLTNSIMTCPGNSCRFSLPCGVLVAANILKGNDTSNGMSTSRTLVAAGSHRQPHLTMGIRDAVVEG